MYAQPSVLSTALETHEDAIRDRGPLRVLGVAINTSLQASTGCQVNAFRAVAAHWYDVINHG